MVRDDNGLRWPILKLGGIGRETEHWAIDPSNFQHVRTPHLTAYFGQDKRDEPFAQERKYERGKATNKRPNECNGCSSKIGY
jgi:hypothetical protein